VDFVEGGGNDGKPGDRLILFQN